MPFAFRSCAPTEHQVETPLRRSHVSRELKFDGFTLLRAFMPGSTTLEAVSTLGIVVALPGLETVQSLVPKRCEESTPNTYSGTFGRGAFPLHTDLAHWAQAPRYLALRSVGPTVGVPTTLLDARPLLMEVGEEELHRSLVRPRRPIGGASSLLRLLECRPEATQLRWDPLFLEAANHRAVSSVTAVEACLSRVSPIAVVLEKDDVLIVDNWRMLHGRGEVTSGAENRHLERCFVKEVAP